MPRKLWMCPFSTLAMNAARLTAMNTCASLAFTMKRDISFRSSSACHLHGLRGVSVGEEDNRVPLGVRPVGVGVVLLGLGELGLLGSNKILEVLW